MTAFPIIHRIRHHHQPLPSQYLPEENAGDQLFKSPQTGLYSSLLGEEEPQPASRSPGLCEIGTLEQT
jgi:hypothetical protein